MLSAGTLHLLEQLSARSEAAYPEGGLLYTYTEKSRRAVTHFPGVFPAGSGNRLSESELERLAMFIRMADGRSARRRLTPRMRVEIAAHKDQSKHGSVLLRNAESALERQ